MGRKLKAVVDSGVQVTALNKECMRGKQCRHAQLKGVAEDNSLMAEVVNDVVPTTPACMWWKHPKKILHLAHWRQLINPGPASSLTTVVWCQVSHACQR